jgi:hypothetical protein
VTGLVLVKSDKIRMFVKKTYGKKISVY